MSFKAWPAHPSIMRDVPSQALQFGIDVEKMDTTFKDKLSKHNVHFVKCQDCHTKGVPTKKHNETAKPTAQTFFLRGNRSVGKREISKVIPTLLVKER